MTDLNSLHNRAVWFDIPVADLDRARTFYEKLLAVEVRREEYDGFAYCVLDHDQGNGGCLVPDPAAISKEGGVLVYLNVDGRIRDAVDQARKLGAEIIEPIHAIGPHGCRAIIRDSEGNRIALHSTVEQ
jgi:predicted enzyme related to lactoylglutathione lyase